MSRASEPSARVAEILEEDRPRRPLELPPTLATGRYVVGRQAVLGVALVVALAVAMLGGRYLLARGDAQPQAVAPQPAATSGTSWRAGRTASARAAPAARRPAVDRAMVVRRLMGTI